MNTLHNTHEQYVFEECIPSGQITVSADSTVLIEPIPDTSRKRHEYKLKYKFDYDNFEWGVTSGKFNCLTAYNVVINGIKYNYLRAEFDQDDTRIIIDDVPLFYKAQIVISPYHKTGKFELWAGY